jgi:flagella basal body P-ring formation protein FlgA
MKPTIMDTSNMEPPHVNTPKASAPRVNTRDAMTVLRLFIFAACFGMAIAAFLGLGTWVAAANEPARPALADILLAPKPAPGPVALRSSIRVDTPLVRLSDLATGTFEDGDTPLFRAPKPGTTGSVAVTRVVEAVRRLGYERVSTGGITQVTVTRTARTITRTQIAEALAAHLIFLGHAEKDAIVDVRLDPGVTAFHVEQSATGAVRVLKLDASPSARRFSALVTVEGSQLAAAGIRVSGFAEELIEVPTLARPVNRGETISPTDVILTPMPLSKIGQDTIMRIDEVAGMAARRAMRADRMVSSGDLMRPLLVRKDDLVSIIYRHSGLTLTVRGRAVSQGAEGDVISVLNLQSKRMLRGAIAPDGAVIVNPTNGQMAALNNQ